MVRYEKYKDSGIAWIDKIPNSWNVRKLKFVFTFGKGLSITKDDLTESGVSVISYGQIHSKENLGTGIIDPMKRYIDADYLTTNKQSLVRNNDFIFADTSEDLDGVGNCVFVDNDDVLFAGYHTIILRVKDIQHNKYLAYLFLSDYWRNQIRSRVTGVKVYSITKTILNNNTVLLPSIPEQEQIAKYLDWKCGEVDRIVEVRERQIKLLGELRASVISRAVTRGLNPNAPLKDSGIDWIGQIPENWEICRLKNACSLKGRIGWKGLRSEEFEQMSYAYLVTGQDFHSAIIDWTKCYQISKERYDEDPYIQLSNGDLLITKDGTIGKIAKVSNTDKPSCLNSGIFVIKQTKALFEQSYLYWLLESSLLKEFNNYTSTGTTILHLYQNVFENMPFIIPSLSEQQQIAEYLDKKTEVIDSTIDKFKVQIDKLKEYRQALITEVVTGKIDVRGIEIPASKNN